MPPQWVFQLLQQYFQFRMDVNQRLKDYDRFSLVIRVTILMYLFGKMRRLWKTARDNDFKMISYIHSRLIVPVARKWIPSVRKEIEGESEKIRIQIAGDLQKTLAMDVKPNKSIPAQGMTPNAIRNIISSKNMKDKAMWDTGKISGAIYHGGQELVNLMRDAASETLLSNPLHSDLFNNNRQTEAEVISMVANLFGENLVGVMTTGGTESILMAILSYRNRFLSDRGYTNIYEYYSAYPNAPALNIIAGITVHAAFDKAGSYFGIRLKKCERDADGRVDLAEVKSKIDSSTLCVVGSTPNFPNGAFDNIPELSKVAIDNNIGLHVDACLGGFIIAFMEKAGLDVAFPFDFTRNPGVTTMSVDTHKYAYSAKGSSILLYRDTELRQHQYMPVTDWTGGIYATPAIAGSRAGMNSAMAYVALLYNGMEGYISNTRKIVTAARELFDILNTDPEIIPYVKTIGKCDSTVVCFTTKTADCGEKGENLPLNIYGLGDCMSRKFNWNLNTLQNPASLHICVTLPTSTMIHSFIADMKSAIAMCKADPKWNKEGAAGVYGTAASVPTSVCGDLTKLYLDACYTAY